MTVKCDLESAALNIGERVRQIGMRAMQPHRHVWRTEIRAARRRPQKKYFLPGGKNTIAQQRRKNFGQPRTAAEDKCAC